MGPEPKRLLFHPVWCHETVIETASRWPPRCWRCEPEAEQHPLRRLSAAVELELGVMETTAEIGADLSAEYPKPLTDEFVAAADIVVPVGCGNACPVLPGKRYLDWTVPDPEGKDAVEVRRICDELDLFFTDLLMLLPDVEGGPNNCGGFFI